MANKSKTTTTELDINKDVEQEVTETVETKEEPVENKKVIDITLDEAPRQIFRINGDDNRMLALNTRDIGIISRLQEGYANLSNVMHEIANIDTDDLDSMSEYLKKADAEMRKQLDYIFDSNVSEVCASNGSMYDPYKGSFRYEVIIDALTKLYESDLNAEYKKIKQRIQKHTDKYTK